MLCLTVNVRSTAGVVARENGLKSDDSIVATLLDTTKKGGVHIRRVIGVAIAIRDNARVNSL